MGAAPARAQIPVEDQLKSIADNFPSPYDTPSVVIEQITANGRTLSRVLRIKASGMKASLEQASPAFRNRAKQSAIEEQNRTLCNAPVTRQLLFAGAAIKDDLLFTDGTPYMRITTDMAACQRLKKSYDFSGPDRIAPTTEARMRDLARRLKTPLKMETGTFTKIEADGVLLKRRMVISLGLTKAQFDQVNRDAMIRQQCKNANVAKLILDGGRFQDTLVSPDGDEIAIVITDRASCHRVTR